MIVPRLSFSKIKINIFLFVFFLTCHYCPGHSGTVFPDFMGAMVFQQEQTLKNIDHQEETSLPIKQRVELIVYRTESNPVIQAVFWKSKTFKNFTKNVTKNIIKDPQALDVGHLFIASTLAEGKDSSLPKGNIFQYWMGSFFSNENITSLMEENVFDDILTSTEKKDILDHPQGPLFGFFTNITIKYYIELVVHELSVFLSYKKTELLNLWEDVEESTIMNIEKIATTFIELWQNFQEDIKKQYD